MAADINELKLTVMADWHLVRVSELMREGFDDRWTPTKIREFLKRDSGECVVGISGGAVVAFAIYRELGPGGRKGYYISFFGIAVDRRRAGLGSRFYAALCEPANYPVKLSCRSRNVAGQAFWRSLGFKARKIKRGYYIDPTDDAVELTKEPRP